MKLNGKICQSGGKKSLTGRLINEDGLSTFNVNKNGKEYQFIILMDGVTGLGRKYEIEEGLTPAEWYVKFMLSEMQKQLQEEPTIQLETIVEQSILKVIETMKEYEKRNNMQLEEFEKPAAGLSLLRTDGQVTEVFLLGDLDTIVAYKNGNVERVDNLNQKIVQALDRKVLSSMKELAKERGCSVLDTITDPKIKEMLELNRGKKNNAKALDAYWVCGTTTGVSEHGLHIEFDNLEILDIILGTDGFDYSMLYLDEKDVYEVVKKYGVAYVAKAIRSAQDIDWQCNKFPRFKKGDDVTAVHLDYREND